MEHALKRGFFPPPYYPSTGPDWLSDCGKQRGLKLTSWADPGRDINRRPSGCASESVRWRSGKASQLVPKASGLIRLAPMAPSNGYLVHREEERLPTKEKNKLRKPLVEKMRRDRINSSIEQLKVLLEKEFQRHQPNSKLEKADILEVAVTYLKQQHQRQGYAFGHKNSELDFNTGYLRCLKEALYFLSLCEPKKETQRQLITHFCKVHIIADATHPTATATGRPLASSPCPMANKLQADKKPPGVSAPLWRPW